LILVNAAIVGAGFYYFEHIYRHEPPVLASASNTSVEASLPELQRTEPEISNPAPTVIIQTNQFHWREVESTDYRTYIANLRAIGCPEATIKDIILTDIMKMFAERRGKFFQNGHEFKFWETSEKQALTARQLEERDKQMAKLDKELPGILRDLLGVNYDREINKYFVDNQEDARRLSFVPEEKRNQLLALREEIEGLKERVVDQAKDGEPVDLEALKKIQEHKNEVLAQILTPEERQEYELRTSETAERLRAQLVGFNPTEEEFRKIFSLWQAHDEKFAFVSADDENARRAKEEDTQRIEKEIKSTLDPVRLTDYDRAQSKDYQQLCFFAERYELPQGTTQALQEIRQIAEKARQSLLAEQGLAEADRTGALKAVQEETQRALRQNLGDKLYPAYARNMGNWIDGLGAATKDQ
jgi:hypothetical protein